MYLTTHDICQTFEDCIETLIVKRPDTTEGVTDCLLEGIEEKMKHKEPTAGNPVSYFVILAATKKASEAIEEHLQDIAAARSAVVTRLQAGPSVTALPTGVSVFLTGVETVKQCHALEVRYGLPRAVVLIKDTEPLAGSEEERSRYIMNVNPVVEYYGAMNCLATVTDITEVNSAMM